MNELKNLRLNNHSHPDLDLDVAVIGAGTSGLYTAYRLATTPAGGPPKRAHVFEMSNRVGGRLESVALPGMSVTGELGGMRYLNSQQIVTQLIENVFAADLQHIAFPMGDPADLLFYLRKQRLHADAWTKAQTEGRKQETRYFLNDEDQGFSADQLFNKVIYEVLMADPEFVKHYGHKVSHSPDDPYTYTFTLNARDWDDIKPNLRYYFAGPYHGMRVNDLGFWNLIKDRVSEEGYNFLDQGGGYYSNTINWNAAEAFPYMIGDFSTSPEFRTIAGGYDLIAYALAYHYLQTEGSMLWIENRLLTFTHSDKPGRKYRLTFRNTNSQTNWHVYADQVVLGLPRRSLELLDPDCLLYREPAFNYNLEAVIMEPSFKLLMGFEYPWWRQHLGAQAGHSVTDLPMRQCYYFGTDPENEHSLFLSSYNDMRTVTFWKALHDNHPQKFQLKATRLLAKARMPFLKDKASEVMVAEAMNQVRELHGMPDIPEPYVALYRDWTDDPYGGGYHAWKAAYNVQKTMRYMRNPNPNEGIYICGEAYSDQQGWVEGALCEAEKMLRDHFALPRPEWLPQDYYLGW